MPANAIDLTLVATIVSWLTIQNPSTAEQQNIQDCVTAASAYWLWALGMAPQNGDWPTVSPLKTPVTNISETYDGNGASRMFLRIRPIQSVLALSIDGITVPASTAVTVPGYIIDGTAKSIAIRSGSGGPAPGQRLTVGFGFLRNPRSGIWYFNEGVQNVSVTYTAGFTTEPLDIEMAVRQMVAVNYKRRQWIDQRSQAMAQGAGTISFRDWEFPPEVKSVMDHYRRRALT
jgi:hypothetical protein